jgi:hypothetical protein
MSTKTRNVIKAHQCRQDSKKYDVGRIRTYAPEGTRFLVLRDNHSATTPGNHCWLVLVIDEIVPTASLMISSILYRNAPADRDYVNFALISRRINQDPYRLWKCHTLSTLTSLASVAFTCVSVIFVSRLFRSSGTRGYLFVGSRSLACSTWRPTAVLPGKD